MPASEQQSGSTVTEFDGYIQYDVMVPLGTGTETCDAMAQLIGDVFTPPRSLTDPTRVHILRSETLAGRDDGIWYWVPVIVTIKAYAVIP